MFCSRTEMFRGIASSTNPSVSFCHRMTFSFSICSRMIGFHAFMLTLLNMLMSFECVFSFDDVRSPGPSGPRVVIDKSFCQRVWGPNRFFFKRPERADAALRARASHPARVADGKASSSGSGSHALVRLLLLEHTLVSGWSSEILEHPRTSFFERLLGATAPGACTFCCAFGSVKFPWLLP